MGDPSVTAAIEPRRSRIRRAFLEWNPLEWSVVDRCMLVAWIMLPFSVGYWVLDEIALLRPDVAPYYDLPLLAVFQHALLVFVLGWVVLLALRPWFRRRAPRGETALVWVTIQLYSVGNAAAAVCTGPTTTPHMLVLVGGVGVAFVLFETRAVVAGIVSSSLIVAPSIVGAVAGWLPYAPLLTRAPTVDGHASRWWIAQTSVVAAVAAVALITLFAYLTARLRDRERRLRDLAWTDPLTGVSNRRRFLELFAVEFERAMRYGEALSCVMLDLDHFKGVNDRYGHLVGDRVLAAAADAFRTSLRAADVIARWGGEEFAVLLPHTDLAGAQAVAERCRRALEDVVVQAGAVRVGITVSIGVAGFPDSRLDGPDALMRSADDALYQAKSSGRNCVVSVRPPAPTVVAS